MKIVIYKLDGPRKDPMKIVALIVAIVALETAALAQPSAEDLYTEGQAAYDHADYATAVTRWQASYDLSEESGLLFNLAQAKRLSGDCVGALATYRRFVAADADPTSDQHKLAVDFTRELEAACPPKVEGRDPSTTSALNLDRGLDDRRTGSFRPGRTWKIAGLVSGGVGVSAIVVGLGLGYHGSSIGDEITAACATSCDWGALKDKDARGARAVAVGKALGVVGVAAVAGGAIFYYVGERREAVTIAPASGGGGVVSWSGAW